MAGRDKDLLQPDLGLARAKGGWQEATAVAGGNLDETVLGSKPELQPKV